MLLFGLCNHSSILLSSNCSYTIKFRTILLNLFPVTSLGQLQSQKNALLKKWNNSAFMSLIFPFFTSAEIFSFSDSCFPLSSFALSSFFPLISIYFTYFSLFFCSFLPLCLSWNRVSSPPSIKAGMFLRQTEVGLESIQRQPLFKWRGYSVMTCVGKTDRGHSQSSIKESLSFLSFPYSFPRSIFFLSRFLHCCSFIQRSLFIRPTACLLPSFLSLSFWIRGHLPLSSFLSQWPAFVLETFLMPPIKLAMQ